MRALHRRRSPSRLLVLALLVLTTTGLVVVATAAPRLAGAAPGPAPLPAGARTFAPTSPFNLPIGPTVTLDRNNTAMVATMTGVTPTANFYEDVPPIYEADASTPRHRISCTMSGSWGPCPLGGQQVPIPIGAVPSAGSDDNMVVIDRTARKVYGFWQYRGDTATASWGEVTNLDGAGNDPFGATGSGISRLAGVIRTDEVRRGRIDHALVGSTGNSCTSFRFPAIRSDGWSNAPGCVPEGTRVQLDPSVDCARLPGARPFEVMVCRALQEYGWYNIDNGGPRGRPWFGVQFENPAGESDPYPAAGVAWDHMAMSAVPWNKLRVLAAWNSHTGATTTPAPAVTPTAPAAVPTRTPAPPLPSPLIATPVLVASAAPPTPTPTPRAATPSADREDPDEPDEVWAYRSGTRSITVGWSASWDDVGISRYTVLRRASSSDGWTSVASTAGSVLAFTDSTVTPGTKYSYRVQAIDLAGKTSDESSSASARA